MPSPPLHPQLRAALAALALDPDTPPEAEVWPRLLVQVSEILYQADEVAFEPLQAAPQPTAERERTHARFIANTSHELRTPLNAILGYSQMLHEELDESGHAALVDDLDKVQRSARRLSRMIDDILDLSRMDAGDMRLHREWVDVGPLVEEAVEAARAEAEAAGNIVGVSVDLAGLGPLLVDRARLRQCVDNLLSNAVKFTRNGRIDVALQRHGSVARLTVSDTGVGMTLEQQRAVFGDFAQGDDSDRRGADGLGLGLPLTRRLVELLGGPLSVTSAPGQGSRFVIELPHLARTPAATRRQNRGAATVASSERAVVVIDDDPDVLELVRRILSREGWRVVGAESAREGVDLVRTLTPALVLLDLMLPERSGWEVLQELRSDPALREVPVVILSTLDERPRALASGAAGYLLKPVERSPLVRAVATWAAHPVGEQEHSSP